MGDNKLSAPPPSSRSTGSGPDAPRPWPRRESASSRHGAISRQLFSYSHYKSWADRMRNTWKQEEEEEEAPASTPAR